MVPIVTQTSPSVVSLNTFLHTLNISATAVGVAVQLLIDVIVGVWVGVNTGD